MDLHKVKIGKCPVCGSDVVKTYRGYACINSLETEATCKFFLFNIICNRKISDSEASEFLTNKTLLLDGFSTKEGNCYTSVMNFNQDGSVNVTSQIGSCPKCGGVLYVGNRSVSCSNYKRPQSPCNFTIWRNISGHDLSLSEFKELINEGQTSRPVNTYDKLGNVKQSRFALNNNKEVTMVDTTTI